MNIQKILAKPVWQRLIHNPRFGDLSAPMIETADSFFDFIQQNDVLSPMAGDIHNWLGDTAGLERSLRIDHLQEVCSVGLPTLLSVVRQARQFQAPKAPTQKRVAPTKGHLLESAVRKPIHELQDWDPIAPPTQRPPVPRHVSIPPNELPAVYQDALRRAAAGLPGREAGMQVPARSIVLRIRERLCQYAWSAENGGWARELSLAGIDHFLEDLKQRLSQKPHGLRWASMRAAAEALLVFARYNGGPDEIIQHLKNYFREFEMREDAQKALKFFALLRTGNTTDQLLDLADTLLEGVGAKEHPKKRHQMRNGAAILAIFSNAPLRNASAQLVFGETLFWEQNEWVIRTDIQKTHTARPEKFIFPLHQEIGRFIDELVIADASPVMLPKLRENLQQKRRQLFVLHDGSPAASTYIPRVFHALSGNSFTTLRTMLYSDAVKHHGIGGIELAKSAAHHSSTEIVKKHYIAEQVAELCVTNFQRRRHQRIESSREDYGSLMSALESAADIKTDP